MPVISFDEPDLAEGRIERITRSGVTLTFVRSAAIVRPAVATSSGVRCLTNISQDLYDETGFQKPLVFDFDHLQRRVWMNVGLAERDYGAAVVATLRGLDAAGREVAVARRTLGLGPTPITQRLEISAASDVIRRVIVEYDGNTREYIDDLGFEASAVTPLPRDTIAPVITFREPRAGQLVNDLDVHVDGLVDELGPLTMTLNGAAQATRRWDLDTYQFVADLTLDPRDPVVRARATDGAGNVGSAAVAVDLAVAHHASVRDVTFSQTGLPGAVAAPTRLVAYKTSLVRMRVRVRTADDRPSAIDGGVLIIEGDGAPRTIMLQQRIGAGFGSISRWSPLRDDQEAYGFIPGAMLRPGIDYRIRVQLFVRRRTLLDVPSLGPLRFREIGGVSMLVVPQHRPFGDPLTRRLLTTLAEAARMLPVPDGIAAIDSRQRAGVYYNVPSPLDYTGHLDPADGGVSYEQGYLLHDHTDVSGLGADDRPNTGDEPTVTMAGEYLCINFTYPADDDRDGTIESSEWARTEDPDGGGDRVSPIVQRIRNWSTFVRSVPEAMRTEWNRTRPRWAHAGRAISTPTRTAAGGQNRTGWAGNAGGGETSFWGDLDESTTPFFIHELGHTLGLPHSSCSAGTEAINLLTRTVVTSPSALMCPSLGGSASSYFLLPSEYDRLYDAFDGAGGGAGSGSAGLGRFDARTATATSSPIPTGTATSSVISTVVAIDRRGEARLVWSALGAGEKPAPDGAPADSPYRLRALDAGGKVLAERPLLITFDRACQPRRLRLDETIVAADLAVDGAIAAIEVTRDGKRLARAERAGQPPDPGGVAVETVKTRQGLAFAITWKAKGAIGVTVSATVDGGKRRWPVGAGAATGTLHVPQAALPAGTVQFIVAASNGFDVGEAVSAPVAVERPGRPVATILAPAVKTRLTPEQPLYLVGAAEAPGRGPLAGAALQWFLGRGGQPLGSGATVESKPLPVGKHRVVLVATDDAGAQGIAEVDVVVAAAAA